MLNELAGYAIGGVIAGLLVGGLLLAKEIVTYRMACGHWRFWQPYWPKQWR